MNNKFFVYALVVTIVSTLGCWVNLARSASGDSSGNSGGGSSWNSHSSGGSGGYGGGYSGGGGHK
jgi:hypothetical protein